MWQAHKQQDFQSEMNHKISYLKGMQRTTPNGLGALAFTQCTRTLCTPPATFLFMWLRNEIRFAVVVGTQISRFSIKMNHKISHMKGFHMSAKAGSGAKTFTQCTETLCLPPTTFISLWLWNKIHYTVMAGTQTTFFDQK